MPGTTSEDTIMPEDTIQQRLSAKAADLRLAYDQENSTEAQDAASELLDLVEKLLGTWEANEPGDLATDAELERAREVYGSDDINIDEGALASRYDHGLWVQAWVDLPDEEHDEEWG